MALEYRDRVRDQTATTGTGPFLLALTAPTGFRAFSAFTDGAAVRYSVANTAQTEWEVGQGVWNASTGTLSRDVVYASSNSGALVNFTTGVKTITHGPSAQDQQDAATQTGTQTLTNKTLTNPAGSYQTLTDGSTINWDLNGGQLAYLTLGGFTRNMLAPTNMKPGGSYFLYVTQDSTGGRTIVWDSAFRWAAGTAPTLTATPGRLDILYFISDGTAMFGMPFAKDLSAVAAAPPPPPVVAVAAGFNLSGMEWFVAKGTASSRTNLNWSPPRPSDISTIKSWGLPNLVNRLPISWELLQPILLGSPANATVLAAEGVAAAGSLHLGYVSYIRQVLDQHVAVGAKAIIDLHNYARFRDYIYQGDGSVTGYVAAFDAYTRPYAPGQVVERVLNKLTVGTAFNGTSISMTQFNDVWTRLANEFKNHAGLGGYGLMNEPHDMPGGTAGASTATFSQPAGSISIVTHGASATPGFNNRVAIVAAIAAAAATVEKTVWVPPGTWEWGNAAEGTANTSTNGVIHLNGVKLIGAGQTSVLYANNYQRSSIFMEGSFPQIKQLRLTSAVAPGRTPPFESNKITLFGCNNFTITNCVIEHAAGASIQTSSNTQHGTISFNTIRDSLADSIHLNGSGVTDIWVENNFIERSGDDGVAVVGYVINSSVPTFITARNNVIMDTLFGRGMSVVGGTDVWYYNNYIENNPDWAGIYIAKEGTTSDFHTRPSSRVKVENNTIKNCGSLVTGHAAIMSFSDDTGAFGPNNDIWFLRNDIIQDNRNGIRHYGPQTLVKLDQNRYSGTGTAIVGGTDPDVTVTAYISGAVGYVGEDDPLVWNDFAKSAVDAIRAVDSTTPIYVSGNNWSSAIDFELNNSGYPLRDGAGVLYPNIVYEGHVYLDASSAGQRFDYDTEASFGFSAGEPSATGVTEQTMFNRLVGFVQWCNTNGVVGAVTETGMPTNEGNRSDDRWAKMYKAGVDFLMANNIQLMNWMHSSLWTAQNWATNATINWHDNKAVEPAVSGLMKNTQAVDQCQFFASADKAWGVAGATLTIRVWGRGNLTTPRTFTVSSDSGTLSTSSITMPAGHNPRAAFTFTTASERAATISFTGTGAPWPVRVFSQSNPAGIANQADAAAAICAKYDAAKWEMQHGFQDYNVGALACQAGTILRAVRDSGYATKQNNIYDMKSWWHTELPAVLKHGDNPGYAPPKASLLAGRIAFDGSTIDSTSGLWCKKRVPVASATPSLNSDPTPQDKALFNLNDSFFVVAAFRSTAASLADRAVFSASHASDTHYVTMGFNASAQARLRWVDTAGGTQEVVGSTVAANTNHTMSMRFTPGSQIFRANGVQVGSLAASIAAGTNFDTMLIGSNFYDFFLRNLGFNGQIIGVIAGKGAPTTTELAAMESYLLSLGA